MDFDFSANLKVDALEVVPADFRGLYKKAPEGEGFVLDSDNAAIKSAVAAIGGLNAALKKARADAKAKQNVDLGPLTEYGATPAEIAEAIKAKVAELEGKVKTAPDAKAELERVKAAMIATHGKEKEELQKKIKALEDQLDDHIVGDVAGKAIAEAKGDPILLMPFVKGRVKVQEIEGRRVAVVIDDGGNVRFSGKTAAQMTINELVAELKSNPTYGKLFASEAREGSGHRTGEARGETRRPQQEGGNRTPVQKIAAGLAARATGK